MTTMEDHTEAKYGDDGSSALWALRMIVSGTPLTACPMDPRRPRKRLPEPWRTS